MLPPKLPPIFCGGLLAGVTLFCGERTRQEEGAPPPQLFPCRKRLPGDSSTVVRRSWNGRQRVVSVTPRDAW